MKSKRDMKTEKIKNLLRISALIFSGTVLVSCSTTPSAPTQGDVTEETVTQSETETETETEESVEISEVPEISENSENSETKEPAILAGELGIDLDGEEITWLADYDINPSDGQQRSVALSIFEDNFNGRVNFVYASPREKYTVLDEMIASGEEVDMFPYEQGCFPEGVRKDRFEPLDNYYDYMGMGTGIWDDMSGVIEDLAYNGEHYVMPYSISDPSLIIYSRKLVKDNGLSDPYELYQNGSWNWNTFLDMMRNFVAKNPSGYGITGDFGKALLQSSGEKIVKYSDGAFSNNLGNEGFSSAGQLMETICSENLQLFGWRNYYPTNMSTLFFSASDWALGTSNAENPEADIMAVPFPCPESAEKNYITCNFDAKMLVKNSPHPKAVAVYMMCERMAVCDTDYKNLAREAALAEKSPKSYVTEEQYDAVQSYMDTTVSVPVFDFAYGMGGLLYGDDFSGNNGAVTDKLRTGVLNGSYTWSSVRELTSPTIDTAIDVFVNGDTENDTDGE